MKGMLCSMTFRGEWFPARMIESVDVDEEKWRSTELCWNPPVPS